MKRYLVTNQTETKLPWRFVHARGKRYISLVSVDFIEKETNDDVVVVRTPMTISLHANFVQEDKYLDSFIDLCNHIRPKRLKFEQLYPEDTLRLWFKNIDKISVDMNNCEFVVRLLLEWQDT